MCISCITSSWWCHRRNRVSKKPSIQPTTRIDRFKMAQLSCSFATNCRTKCCFSRAGQGRQQLIPLNSWVYNIKKKHLRDVNVSQRCVSSEKKLILACIGFLRRPRFHDMPQISCTTCCEIQTFGFVSIGNRMNASAFRDLWARVMFWKFSKLHEP